MMKTTKKPATLMEVTVVILMPAQITVKNVIAWKDSAMEMEAIHHLQPLIMEVMILTCFTLFSAFFPPILYLFSLPLLVI